MATPETTLLSPNFLQMVILLHWYQCSQMILDRNLSKPFHIINDVKQACFLAPSLFSIVLNQRYGDPDNEDVVYVIHCLEGSFFYLQRLQAHTKNQKRQISDIPFAIDAALIAHTNQALKNITSCFADASKRFVLEISLWKTDVLLQFVTRIEHRQPHVTIGDVELKSTQQITCLGFINSFDARIVNEIGNSLSKANNSFRR